MFLAAQSMAVGTVMVRWVSKYADPIMATGWVSITGDLARKLFIFGFEAEIEMCFIAAYGNWGSPSSSYCNSEPRSCTQWEF